MLVTKSMTDKVITIREDAGLFEIRNLMKENHIRHLPVVDEKNRLLGIVTDRDLRSAMPYRIYQEPTTATEESERIAQIRATDIMTADPISIPVRYTIQDALLLIDKHRVGAFPVTEDDGTLVGIISVRDLIRAFINVLGIEEPGILLGIVVEEKAGMMKKIVDAVTEENISLGSVLVARYWDENKRVVFPYLLTNTVTRIKKKLEALGFQLLDPMDWYFDKLEK